MLGDRGRSRAEPQRVQSKEGRGQGEENRDQRSGKRSEIR